MSVRRRIVIGLDSSLHGLQALDDAAEMAARIEAELVGLFVEDDTLLKLAALPFSSEVGIASARARSLNARTIERTFRTMAEKARRALAAAAEKQHIRWSFSTTRGSVVGQLLDAATEVEERRAAKTMLATPAAVNSVLLLQTERCIFPKGAAVIVLDTSHQALRALPAALRLAGDSCTKRVLVLIVAETPFAARRQQQRAAEVLKAAKVRAGMRVSQPLDVEHMRDFLENEHCGALILANCDALFNKTDFKRLVEETEFPIFVMR